MRARPRGPVWRDGRWAPPHTCLALTGGAIGQGFPCATGAAIACPDRRVIDFQADGSAMYTIQALWTQAREISTSRRLCATIAHIGFCRWKRRAPGNVEPGRKARSLTLLRRRKSISPNWRKAWRPGVRVETADDLVKQLERALKEPGPNFIEAIL